VRRVGFWTGVGTLFGAVRELVSTPSLWRHAIVPMVALVTLASVGIGLVTWLGVPHVLHAVVTTESQAWYTRLGSAALATLLWLVGCALVLFLSWVVTPPLCSPALEAIVQRVESTLGAPPQPELSFWTSFTCGLRAQLMGLATLIPAWSALWVLGLVLPFLAPLLFPAKLLAVGFSLAWNLLDYPLTLRGVPARERLRFVRRHFPAVMGFGLAFACLFWVPLAAVLLLPLGVIGATRLVWRLAKSELPDGEKWLLNRASNGLSR
jgi:CysZ protein